MYLAFITSWLIGSRHLIAFPYSRTPYTIGYIVFTILAFAIIIGLRIWRGDKISTDTLGKGLRRNLMDLKNKNDTSPNGNVGFDWTKMNAVGSMCPRCGKTAGAGAITCPNCGSSLPMVQEEATPVQLQIAQAQTQVGSAVQCPSCGYMLAAGMQICPQCSWRLREGTGAPERNQPRIGIVRRDVTIGGALAFKKDEWVSIEGESPDPDRPQYKYVVLSKALGKKYRLSDADISVGGLERKSSGF